MTPAGMALTEKEVAELICANTEKVFVTMLGLTARVRPEDEKEAEDLQKGGVVALLGFAGDWRGSGSIRCSARLACSLSGKLLMTEFGCVNDEVLDAIGEIANMIIGNFKDDAACKLGPLGLSTPTVVYGNNFEARNWNGQSWVGVTFDCEGDPFEVKISLLPSPTRRETVRPSGVSSSRPALIIGY